MAVSISGGGQLNWRASLDDGSFNKQLNQLEQRLGQVAKSTQNQAKQTENFFKTAAAAAAGYATLAGATDFVRQVIKVRGEFQQLDVAFTTILKSKEKADKLMGEIVQLAATTPFSLTEVATAGKQLLAYGFAADQITDTLTNLGNVAAGVSAPIGDIAYLYGTLRTQGRAYTKDIQQFTGRGIPIIAELAKQFGTAESNVLKLVETGKVGFPEVEKAFQAMTGAGGIFFNLMEEQSKTLTGRISNLGDAFDKMLNEIGSGNEGILYAGIAGLNTLVENYQTVIDIIGSLIVIYGSYRAALIAEAAIKNLLIARTTGLTAAEFLRYQGLVIQTAAQRALNFAMAAMPLIALTTGIAALAAITYSLASANDTAEKAQESLNDITEDATVKVETEKKKIEDLVKITQDRTASNEDQVKALNKIIAINPVLLKGLDLQNIGQKEGIRIIDDYLKKLKEKAIGELAYAAEQKSIARIIELQTKGIAAVDTFQRVGLSFKNLFSGNQTSDTKADQKNIVNQLIKEEKESIKKGRELYDKEIKKVQLADVASPVTAITATTDVDKKDVKKYADLLKQRLDLETDMQKSLSEARQKALTDEDREFEEINQRYDEQIKKIEELNAKLNPKDRLSTKGVEDARSVELGLAGENAAIDNYKKEIDAKKEVFNQFEDYKAKFGAAAANTEFKENIGEFDSFLAYLDAELAKRKGDNNRLSTGKNEIVSPLKVEAEKSQKESFNNLLIEFQSYQDERKRIIEKYLLIVADLRRKGFEAEATQAIVKGQEELTALDTTNIQKLDSYRKLFDAINFLSRSQTKRELENLQDELNARIKSNAITVEAAKETQDEINKLKQDLRNDVTEGLDAAANSLRNIAGAVGQIDEQFGNLINTASNVVASFSELNKQKQLYDQAQKSGDQLGKLVAGAGIAAAGIGIVTSVISGVTKFFKAAKESREQSRAEISAYEFQQFQAEFEVNELYRERLREQVKLNKLKIDGLNAEAKLLKEQATTYESDFKRVFADLQKERAVIGKKEEKYGGFLGIGRKTRVVDIAESLAGKSFEDIERLFLSGKLEGKAKELFETLNKLKQQGADVNAILAENQQQANEIFTGTTASGLLDGIISGLKEGKTQISDFAEFTEGTVRDAMLNALKYKVLEGPINKLYEQFAKDAESNGGLDDTEIANFTQNLNATIGNALKIAEGFDLGTTTKPVISDNSLQGAIKGISAEQADLLAGQFGGLRITGIQQLEIATSHLSVALKIETNTGRTAANTDRLTAMELSLRSIDRKMDSSNKSLEAAGLGG